MDSFLYKLIWLKLLEMFYKLAHIKLHTLHTCVHISTYRHACLLCIFYIEDKTQVQFLKYNTLDSPIKFKHPVVLTHKTQTMSSFPRIIKSDAPKCLNLIGELNVLYLNFTLSKKVSKNCTSDRIKQTCPTPSRLLRIHSQPKYIWDYKLVVVKTQTDFR